MNLDGTARRTLWTHPIADHTSLTLGSWSPDGRLLAVTTHFAALGGGGSVYLIDPQGQVAGQIDDPNQDTVTWSPDGKELALGGGCSPCAIKVYDTHTFKQVRTVDKVQPAYLGFAWGPNARMASVQQSQTSGGLYTVAPDNTDPRPLVPGNVYSGYTHSLTTGPGNRVYYFDAKGLNVVRDDVGAIPVQIADTTAVGPLAPSPDGSLVAYKTGSSIAVVSSDGGSPNTLPTPGGCPAFAPDGRLLFSNSSGLWISDADGSNAKLIAAGGTCPTPSPA